VGAIGVIGGKNKKKKKKKKKKKGKKKKGKGSSGSSAPSSSNGNGIPQFDDELFCKFIIILTLSKDSSFSINLNHSYEIFIKMLTDEQYKYETADGDIIVSKADTIKKITPEMYNKIILQEKQNIKNIEEKAKAEQERKKKEEIDEQERKKKEKMDEQERKKREDLKEFEELKKKFLSIKNIIDDIIDSCLASNDEDEQQDLISCINNIKENYIKINNPIDIYDIDNPVNKLYKNINSLKYYLKYSKYQLIINKNSIYEKINKYLINGDNDSIHIKHNPNNDSNYENNKSINNINSNINFCEFLFNNI
jgi:hypothetical protein